MRSFRFARPLVAVVLGGRVAVLLHLKEPLHRFVGRSGEGDLRAIMQLVLQDRIQMAF